MDYNWDWNIKKNEVNLFIYFQEETANLTEETKDQVKEQVKEQIKELPKETLVKEQPKDMTNQARRITVNKISSNDELINEGSNQPRHNTISNNKLGNNNY